ncbi:MAG: EAL domain-containing protein [Steroidobacteraceae bacterium]
MEGTATRTPDAWAQLEPYAQLLTALVPRAAGVELYDPIGALRWSSANETSTDLASLVGASIDRAAALAESPGELVVMPGGVPAYLFWLRADAGELVATLAILWRESEQEPRSFSLLHSLVRPALECLRRELLSRGNIRRLNQALSARDRDLDMLLSASGAMNVAESADELASLLRNATDHLECAFGALIVPEKSLVIVRHAAGSGEAADKQALAQTHRHLIAVAQRRVGPVILNRLPSAPGAQPLPYRVLSSPVRHPSGRTMGVLALYRPAARAEFVEREAQLTDLLARRTAAIIESSYDAITGLLNRQAFEQRVRVATGTAGSTRRWSILYVDVDQLHVVNDNCGMHVGDRVIAQIGELIRTRLVPGALAARISGDRFAVLLPSSCEDAGKFAESLRVGVAELPMGVFGTQGDARVTITVSIGVAEMRSDEEFSHNAVIAETACKAAKDRGRNRVEVYQNTDLSLVRRYEDVNLVPNLRMAMSENRLRLDAQLIMPMHAGGDACWHFELLLRMIDDKGTTLGPDRFLSAAVRYQFMPAIDRWVVQRAIDLLKPQAELLETRPVVFTINLSGQSVTEAGFADFLIQAVRDSGLNPSIFCFELTESAAVGNLANAEALMRRLRDLGCSVALDDFGTGLSSLAYLRQLPIDMLKIDGSFVRDILKDPRAESMVQAIAHLARAMNLTTVAEYVETDEIRLRIAALGVDYGQGFAIARPTPLTEVLAELPLYVAAEPVAAPGGGTLDPLEGLGDGIVVELDDELPLALTRSL